MMKSSGRQGRRDRSMILGLTAAVVVTIFAGCSTQQTSDGAPSSGEPRIIRQFDLPLLPAGAEPGVRAFSGGSVRGTLEETGDWRARGEITHRRLRCATYRMALRFGSGEKACEGVAWQTDRIWLPSRAQCNSATVVHSGEGSLGLPAARVDALTCVRVSVECTGACG
jgi:hypothetical protein